ncbi:UvrD-helicase domain-containing protein [Formosa maritima]|uniref:DNA 3'-5' helicase n=1 Tax=Formosa maritima TaxID=2592046 RepID=A0A5D0GN62_9FLAO|nr:UvrD-helicase domain-containing protein [Formosa maritima]TYA60150.1 AAA family ATPase [Formosa maritima]
MNGQSSFLVYNASAGSGKTFSLVKEYLKIIIKSPFNDKFKHILAITFTNKAASEMKDRIIDTLKSFSSQTILEHPNDMFQMICSELQMTPLAVHEKSKTLLNTIVYNYAFFDISTIDGFTHKIIRTFAYDLKLPLNFEVELDQEVLLTEAVDRLIAKAGTDKELTKVLIDFAIEKTDDDKSWDVSYDFYKVSKLLINENEIPFINAIKNKTLEDFKSFKIFLKQEIVQTENSIVKIAQKTLTLIDEAGLEFKDFSRSTLPNHFKKASNLELNSLYDNKLEENISNRTGIYNKTLEASIANTIEQILPEIEVFYKTIKAQVYNLKFLKACYRNITPLSVLNAINKELNTLKIEQNKVLISEFNNLISNEIKEQPTPFIYERLGEKFSHYFIDEFQDTSVLQWENLIPLIDNKLSQENLNTEKGSLMIVGDAKQAIYRWRGGKAEQFIDLFNNTNPFQIKKTIVNLPQNFRSYQEIINFNNSFFKFLAESIFSEEIHQNIYNNAKQTITKNHNGFVSIDFLDINREDDIDTIYTEKTLETINFCLQNGFVLSDICILVRKNKQGVAIADYLNEHKIPLISSETLLLKNSPDVEFAIHFLKLLLQPKNNEIKIQVLNYLAETLQIEAKHAFFEKHINLNLNVLFASLQEYNIYIQLNNLLQLSLFELVESIIRSFNLVETSNAYIQYLLDLVFEYTQKTQPDLLGFIEYYEKKKDKLSIVLPPGQEAVQIMTIHKSKGLEFPVVIFPYADLDIYKENEPKEWFPLNPENFQGFNYSLLNFSGDFENFGEIGNQIYNRRRANLELDNINILYVALTRAVEQLFVISKKDVNNKGEIKTQTYSGFLINYLIQLNLWNNNQSYYTFGKPEKSSEKKSLSKNTIEQKVFISSPKHEHNIKIVTNSGLLWDTHQKEAIEKGNLIHEIMSQIKTETDIDFVINEFIFSNIINKEQALILKEIVLQIVLHKDLTLYFSDNVIIYNERDIISKSGEIIRLDRLVINNKNQAIIIDYKTGIEDPKHLIQLNKYENILLEMNIKTIKKILVYINEGIQIKEF